MKTGEVQEAISKGSALRLVAGASIAILCLLNVYLGEILNEHHEASVALHSLLQFTGAADSFDRYSREPVPKPPFEAIVQGWNVTGDASWLLDFAIVGFPKCGTSSLMFHLLRHPQVSTFEDERCEISYNQQVKLMKDLYDKPPGSRRGIKCPMDLESTKLGMRNYDKYFPATDMIVGIRHPVLWFESFYNFRIQNQFHMPPPNELIGKCRRGGFNVCTFRGNFHVFLSNLHKTNRSSDELQYMHPFRRALDPLPKSSRKVFLYEVSQLNHDAIRQDLADFLHLTIPLDPVIWFKPGKNHTSSEALASIAEKQIDVCEWPELRQVLQEQAVNVSRWIREYFILADDVVVSDRSRFVRIMERWEEDPCDSRTNRTTRNQ